MARLRRRRAALRLFGIDQQFRAVAPGPVPVRTRASRRSTEGSRLKVVEVTAGTLSGVRLFRGLGDQQRREIARYCRGGLYPEEAEILSLQQRSDSVYFVISGRVRVTFPALSAKVDL